MGPAHARPGRASSGRETRVRSVSRRTVYAAVASALLAIAALAGPQAASAGLHLEWAHASNAGTTDRNLGRNFVNVGWRFPSGFIVSGGPYIAGEQYCFESLTFGQELFEGKWLVTLTAHPGGSCSIDGGQVDFEPNHGACGARILIDRPRWTSAIGACIWSEADYTIGNYRDGPAEAAIGDVFLQPTAFLMIRVKLSRPGSSD